MEPFPISSHLIRWLVENVESLPEGVKEVATVGFGPIEEYDFDEILRSIGLEIYQANEYTEILIVGREGWDRRQLEDIIDARSGSFLQVFSQELFVAYVISGRNPLLEYPGDVRDLTNEHPALLFMESVGFNWPTTFIDPTRTGIFEPNLLQIGFLRGLGYSVGENGVDQENRRVILTRAYTGPVPPRFPNSYIQEWGQPNSSKRLKKIAQSIAAFCRNAKRRENPPEQAINDWEYDLRWLKQMFYDDHYQFRWPDTEVW